MLSPTLVGSVIMESGLTSLSDQSNESAMDVGPMDLNLQDAVVRLARLLETPGDAQVLMPLIAREIVYWLLTGSQGARLRHLAIMEGNTSLITRAVARLREDISRPQRIEDLAHELGMSVSGLHHQFKAITSMSPLQFQKQLRLQEARRLMLSENLDAVSTAYRLGYHDAAHFNREYKSLFGLPPARDIQQLKQAVMANAG